MKSTLLVMLVVMLGVSVVSVAQDDWPEGCQLPDFEAAMNVASVAQMDGDVATFVASMGEISRMVDDALEDCLQAAGVVEDENLPLSDLWFVNLHGVDLSGIDLQDAGMYGADLRGVDFTNANLQGAYLHDANLEGADLSYADLRGTNFMMASLINTNLTGAMFDETTVLPDSGGDTNTGVFSSYWTPETDMAMFTDPEHPDFWDVCVEMAGWSPMFCRDRE